MLATSTKDAKQSLDTMALIGDVNFLPFHSNIIHKRVHSSFNTYSLSPTVWQTLFWVP